MAMKVVSEQARIERAKCTALIVQLDDDCHELKGKLESSKRCKNVADLHYSLFLFKNVTR